jgi:sec-independent protein translocase protein TatA
MEFMIGRLGPAELILILGIIILLFGPGRIGNIAGELGKGIRAFREGVQGDTEARAEAKDQTEDAEDQTE